jgi:hypothetical protein
MPTQTLEAIQRRIAQQDSELQALRRELEARQNKLQSLTQRKETLQSQLRQVEAEMAAIRAGTRRAAASAPKSGHAKPAPKAGAARRPGQLTLAQLIVAILQETGRPLTVQQLTQEVKRRGFKTTSKAPYKLVGKNVYTLAGKGVLRRAPNQAGFLVVHTGNGKAAQGAAAPRAKGAGPTPKTKSAANGAVKAAPGPKRGQQKPLRQVLEQILQESNKPMTGGELAAKVAKSGYKTKSKRLADNVWTALGNMNNVENIKGQGYRLKPGRS